MAFYLQSDNVAVVDEVKDTFSGEYITTATVTVTLHESDGTELYEFELEAVDDIAGTYRGTIPFGEMNLTEGRSYYLLAVIEDGGRVRTKKYQADAIFD